MKQIDISIPRWMYWSDEVESLHICPKCKSSLINEKQMYLIGIEKRREIKEFIIGYTEGGYFCPDCPTVVLDKDKFLEVAITASDYADGFSGSNKFFRFMVEGVINLEAIPKDKRSLPLGDDDNPIPLVEFANYNKADPEFISVRRASKTYQVPRSEINEPYPYGSGKKYKKCCGR